MARECATGGGWGCHMARPRFTWDYGRGAMVALRLSGSGRRGAEVWRWRPIAHDSSLGKDRAHVLYRLASTSFLPSCLHSGRCLWARNGSMRRQHRTRWVWGHEFFKLFRAELAIAGAGLGEVRQGGADYCDKPLPLSTERTSAASRSICHRRRSHCPLLAAHIHHANAIRQHPGSTNHRAVAASQSLGKWRWRWSVL